MLAIQYAMLSLPCKFSRAHVVGIVVAEAVALLRSTAAANGIGDLARPCELEWGNRRQISTLLDQIRGLNGTPTPPGLVLGADVLYDVDAIPALVETIARLGAPRALISFAPRRHGSDALSCSEEEILIECATRHGLTVERLERRGDDLWDCVLVVALVRS